MPLDMIAQDREYAGLQTAQYMEEPHRKTHIEIEEISDANNCEIDENLQPYTIAKKTNGSKSNSTSGTKG